VRLAAIRLAEKWLAQQDDKEVFERVTTLADPTPRVILQLALSLGVAADPRALITLADLADAHGHQPYVADAIVSGLAGRELDFLKVVTINPHAAQADRVVTLAASAVLKAGDATRTASLLDFLAPATPTATWARPALLDGVERFLPKTPEGKSVAGVLPVEPRALELLAAQPETASGAQAARLLTFLKWPGKPGLEQETAAIAARLTPEQQALFEKGRTVFAGLCAACHQPHGEGLSGLAPQLLYSHYVLGPERILARIVLCGKESDGLVMPSLRTLDDESLAAALTYVRQSWGHNAPPVAPAVLTAVRREIAGREEPWTDEELEKLARTMK
jgi:mono/diheme cytochrome c family protein